MDPYIHNQQQNHNRSSGLTRYRSAPSSFFDCLINGSNYHGDVSNGGAVFDDDYRFIRSPSPEIENLFTKCLSSSNGGKFAKQEENKTVSQQNGYANGSEMVYRNLGVHNLVNGSSAMDSSYGVMNDMGGNDRIQAKTSNCNGSNLARQNSSPAVFLSNLGFENGLNGHMNLSYGLPSSNPRHMPQIAEDGPESISNFSDNSWNKTSFNVLNGSGEDITFSSLESHQNRNSKNNLTHHSSLPTTFSEMARTEKFLHFQGTVPCKIRAKRGCATHPRSIAERARRTRISERMRKLQDLFPNMDKHTNTADMLDMAVAQIKELQKQVKTLMDTKVKCTCVGKAEQMANFSVA